MQSGINIAVQVEDVVSVCAELLHFNAQCLQFIGGLHFVQSF